jgi:hypothetical protein
MLKNLKSGKPIGSLAKQPALPRPALLQDSIARMTFAPQKARQTWLRDRHYSLEPESHMSVV